jgi:hypothetical protein
MASQEPSPWSALLPGHDQKPLRVTSSPLHKRAEDGELLWVRTALDAGADVHDQGGLYGRTLLHVAASGNRLALARLLLDRGANPAAADMVREDGVCCASCVHWESVVESQQLSDQPANARSSPRNGGEHHSTTRLRTATPKLRSSYCHATRRQTRWTALAGRRCCTLQLFAA